VVVVAALVALLVGEIVDQVVNAATPAARRGMSTWVAAVTPIVADSNDLGSVLHVARGLEHLPSCSTTGCQRTTFDAYLAQLVSGSSDAVQQLDGIGLVAPSPRAVELLRQVLTERARASSELVGAISLLLGPSQGHLVDARVQGELLAVGSQLTGADAAYRRFLKSLPRHSGDPSLASSAWVTDPAAWTRAGVQGWASRLLGADGLQSSASIALLAVSTSPPVLRVEGLPTTTTSPATTTSTSTTTTTTTPPLGATTTTSTTTTTTTTVPPTTTTLQVPPPGSVSVLQPATGLSVEVVVANAGNVRAASVALRAVLTAKSGKAASAGTVSVVTQRVGPLAPGAARYLRLHPMAVHEGETYVLTVTATVSGWKQATEQVTIRVAA
jgi:hypothetical protein